MERIWLYLVGEASSTPDVNPPPTLTAPDAPPTVRRFSLGTGGADLLIVLGLLAASFCVYGQTLRHGFINLDDPGYVFENSHVTGGLTWENFCWAWTSFAQSNWHPLTWLSLMADAQCYGANAGGYHLTNLLLHAANAALLFWWLRRATGARWRSASVALLFVVHPMHVESVAWVSERKDVLSLCFCGLTLLAYTRHAHGGGKAFYALSLAAFALGLTAKPMLVTVPFLLLLLDYWPLRRLDGTPPRLARLVLEKTPFFLLVAASCAVTFAAQRHGGAVVPLELLPLGQRIVRALVAYGAYLGKTFWPLQLGAYYPYWPHPPLWQTASCAALLPMATGAAWRLRRIAPYAWVGWGWFLGALAPVIGIVQVGGQAMADRYVYLPHIGLFILLCWAGGDAWRRSRWLRPWLAAGAAASAAACLVLACGQAAYWRSGVTLFAHTTAIAPRPTVLLYVIYGDACFGERWLAEAEAAYGQALGQQPNNPDLLGKMGALRLAQGRWLDAADCLSRADRLRPDDENTLNGLGRARKELGQLAEAADAYLRCLSAHPQSVDARLGLADALLAQGQPAAAAAQYEAALARQADCVPALTHLTWLLAVGGDERLRDPARALALAQRAVSLTKGEDVNSLDALAAAVAANGRWPQAAAVAQAALQAAQRSGVPPAAVEVRRERLALYQANQWPKR